MSPKYYMTFGESKGRKIAIITEGHFRMGDDETVILETTDKCRNMKQARTWYKRMLVERPWETRQ